MGNEFEVLGIDIGVYSTKTSNDVIFRSAFNENTLFNIGNKSILEYEGRKYQIGAGRFNAEIIKAHRDTLPLLLYAISQSTQRDDVKIVIGMPKYQLDNDEYVDEVKHKFIGDFAFKVDGVNRKISILDVTIFPEGMGAYYTITKDLSGRDIILIDIGGSTFNIILFKNNEFIKADTLPFGSMNLLNDIREKVMQIHGGRHSIDDISNYLQRGKVGKTSDTMEYRADLGQKYIDQLITLLQLDYPLQSAELYLSGGGVEVFDACIIKNLGDINLLRDYLFANAKGFKMIGDVIYG